MSEKKYVVEQDATTQEEIRREYTAEEYAQADALAESFARYQATIDAAQAQKEQAAASGISKLEALGLTSEEILAIRGL